MGTHITTPMEKSPGLMLWQVSTLWQRAVKGALDEVGLNHSGYVILVSLHRLTEEHEEVTQAMIVDATRLDKMTVSKSLKILETKNLVVRQAKEQDSRAKSLILTYKGHTLISQAVAAVEAIDETFFSVLKKEDKETLRTWMAEVLEGHER